MQRDILASADTETAWAAHLCLVRERLPLLLGDGGTNGRVAATGLRRQGPRALRDNVHAGERAGHSSDGRASSSANAARRGAAAVGGGKEN